MPEKQTKEFGQIDQSQAFTIKEQQQGGPAGAQQIVLNIAESRGGKVLLRQQSGYVRLTGNPVIDVLKNFNEYLIDHSRVKIRDKATFFRLLAIMVNAGLPIVKSLNTLAGQSEKSPKLARTLFQMAHGIENGKSLSGSMEDFPEVFNEAQVGMVRAGEASGQLNKTLRDLAEEVEKTASINGKIKGALVYPIAILCLLVGVIFVMMIAVIPQLTKIFAQTGKELPLATQILIGVSNFSVDYWPYAIIGIFGLVLALMMWKRTRNGRYMVDLFKLKLPIFGPVIQKAVLAKFSRSLSNMLTSGVPIIKSLEIVANAVGNEVYKKRLFLTAEDMRRGIPLAENMSDSKLFPNMLVNMVEVGEQTAQLDNVTLKVAQFYDEEVDNVVKALTKIMEPLIIVVIGVTVGGLVAAIMLPIIQLTNITGGF